MTVFEVNGTSGDDVFFFNDTFAAVVGEGGDLSTKTGGGNKPLLTGTFFDFDSPFFAVNADGGEGSDVYVAGGGKASFQSISITKFSDDDAVFLTGFDAETAEITDIADGSGGIAGIRFFDPATGESVELALVSEVDGSKLGVDDLQFNNAEGGMIVQPGGADILALPFSYGLSGTVDEPEADILYASSDVEKLELLKKNKEAVIDRTDAANNLVIETDNTKSNITLVYGGRDDVTPEVEECLIFDLADNSLEARSRDDASSGNSASDPFITVVTAEQNAQITDNGDGSYTLVAEDGALLDTFLVEGRDGEGIAGLGGFIDVVEMVHPSMSSDVDLI